MCQYLPRFMTNRQDRRIEYNVVRRSRHRTQSSVVLDGPVIYPPIFAHACKRCVQNRFVDDSRVSASQEYIVINTSFVRDTLEREERRNDKVVHLWSVVSSLMLSVLSSNRLFVAPYSVYRNCNTEVQLILYMNILHCYYYHHHHPELSP